MGQKVNPQGFRLGVSQEPTSYWFAKNRHYSQLVLEDHFLRESIHKKFPSAGIAAIYIERQVDTIKIDISSARPRQLLGSFSKDSHLYTGIQDLRNLLKLELQQYRLNSLPLIQKKIVKSKALNKPSSLKQDTSNISFSGGDKENGLEEAKLPTFAQRKQVRAQPDAQSALTSTPGLQKEGTNDTSTIVREDVFVDPNELVSHISIHIMKLSDPDTSAACLAESIVEQLEKRIPFRRAMKQAVTRAQNASVKGIKVQISGRLNGAEIARSEWILKGRVPLHTLRAKVQYDSRAARTIYGLLGIKVWVFTDD